jgi:hypothetical protein
MSVYRKPFTLAFNACTSCQLTDDAFSIISEKSFQITAFEVTLSMKGSSKPSGSLNSMILPSTFCRLTIGTENSMKNDTISRDSRINLPQDRPTDGINVENLV